MLYEALRGQVSNTGDIRYRQIATGTRQECALACAQSKNKHGDAYFLVEPLTDDNRPPLSMFPPFT